MPFVLFSIKKCIIIISLVLRKHCKAVSRNARAKMVSCVCARKLRETRYKQRFRSDLRVYFESIAFQDRRMPAFEKGRYSSFFSFFPFPLPPAHFPLPSRDRYRTKTPLPRHLVLSTGIFSVMLVTGARTVKSRARSHDKLPRILTARSPQS